MMKNQKKTTQPTSQSAARVVDGKLILSFPEALSPVVWQMSLNEVATSALKVEDKKTKGFTLVMATPSETMDIASFATREQAVEALMAAANALENASGHIGAQSTGARSFEHETVRFMHAQAAPEKTKKRRWLTPVLAILGLIALIGYWGSVQPRAPQSFNAAQNSAPNEQATSPQNQSGVPVSADAFLQGQ
jgi:hypothetical protein